MMHRKEYISDDEYLVYTVNRANLAKNYEYIVIVELCRDAVIWPDFLENRKDTANSLDEVEEAIERLHTELVDEDPLETRFNETIDRLHE